MQPQDAVTQPQDGGGIAPSMDGPLLTTGEMARRSSNTLRTVRFYEEEGILRPVRRTDGGHRLFDGRELERLMLVTDLRAAGLSLDEIKQILDVKQSSTCASDAAKQATAILARRIDELRDKLRVLARLQEDLTQTTDVMTACIDCHDTGFPVRCESCTVMARPSLPRSMRVLWSAHPSSTITITPPHPQAARTQAEPVHVAGDPLRGPPAASPTERAGGTEPFHDGAACGPKPRAPQEP